MAKVVLRRGVWVCDYIDQLGIRRTPSFGKGNAGKGRADLHLADVLKQGPKASFSGDPNITVKVYLAQWLEGLKGLKPATLESYGWATAKISEYLAQEKVRTLDRGRMKWFAGKVAGSGLSRKSCKTILTTFHTALAEAMAEGLLTSNPLAQIKPMLKRILPAQDPESRVRAMTREQLGLFLFTCGMNQLGWLAFFATLSRTGMREGEAIALQWGDVDLMASTILIQRNYYLGQFQTPKGGRSRKVPIGSYLLPVLKHWEREQRALAMDAGTERSVLVFPNEAGKPLDRWKVGRVFREICKAAGLIEGWTVHDLRHTFCANLLAAGANPKWVQQLAGHSSLVTTDTIYGNWIPATDATALDLLDPEPRQLGSKPVADQGESGPNPIRARSSLG